MEREVILDKLKCADMVLVGLGEVFDGTKYLQRSRQYCEGSALLKETGFDWMIPGWKEYCLERLGVNSIESALENLEELLAGKNYFAVSVSTNSRIERNLRVVMPCGSIKRKQCGAGCDEMLSEVTCGEGEWLGRQFDALWEGHKPEAWPDICGSCGAAYTFNTVYSAHYNEKGYLEQWKLYMKWLQGTLHHSLLILELGVGMDFPTVIRWPFEKTVFLNKKAYLCRVHEHLYQMTEELAGKGCGISEDAVDWIARL
ncbi:MAG: hypothetical protein HFH85_08525 [Lachnospiraceae bacterium]|jgi:hypothetical protein|nr:hypothetical protein [Lachnospiraceae bacterium]